MKKEFNFFILASVCLFCLYSCTADEHFVDTPLLEYNDSIPEGLLDAIDRAPAEDLSEEDFELENGDNIVDFFRKYDPDFIKQNPWVKTLGKPNSYSQKQTKDNTNASINAGIINLKNNAVAALYACSYFFTKNSKGVANIGEVKNVVSQHDQLGLWYKFGGDDWKLWSFPVQKPKNDENKKCYGLDCSGMLCSAMNKAGFNIVRKTCQGYYTNLDLMNISLQSFLSKKGNFPENVKDNLKFAKFQYSKNQIKANMKQGDIIFWLENNRASHVAFVCNKKYDLIQSNGEAKPSFFSDNAVPKRGPHIVNMNNVLNYWSAPQYGILRIVATLNDTNWRLNVKCEGADTYITSFNITIKMDEEAEGDVQIEPIQTIGYDYNGDQCNVYVTGTFNQETQILQIRVKKTYAEATRTDEFVIKLVDDSQNDIEGIKIVDAGGCINYLDIENIDNESSNSKHHVNTSKTTLNSNVCTDSGVSVY